MARNFCRIYSTIWSDQDWLALSQGAQHTYMLLLSHPKVTLVGLLDYLPSRWARLAADTSLASVEAAIDELVASRHVLVDPVTDELLIRTLVRHDIRNIRTNSNLLKGLWRAWESIQSRQLRLEVIHNLPDDIWASDRCRPPNEALQMRRSDPLEPTVQTNHRNGSLQPPSSLLPPSSLAASPLVTSPPAGATTAAPDDDQPSTTADGRQRRLDAAVDLLVDRELARNPTRNGNPERHANAVRRGKVHDHRQAAHQHLADHPDLTAAQLADLLEPPPAPATDRRPVVASAYDDQQLAARQRQEANMRRLAASTPERADPDAVQAALATARQHVRQPHANGATDA